VERDFTAAAPNRLWVADFTYVPTWSGTVYVAFVIDVFSRRIVGWRAATRMTTELVLDTLEHAVWSRRREGITDLAGLVHHTDAGSQFRSRKYVLALDQADLLGSMGRVAACADNAAMESFFSLLQKNVLNRKRWDAREELRLAIVTWIERTYHRRRRQEALGRLTPVEFEMIHHSTTQTATAA
jgi:transposase InsO family protein